MGPIHTPPHQHTHTKQQQVTFQREDGSALNIDASGLFPTMTDSEEAASR